MALFFSVILTPSISFIFSRMYGMSSFLDTYSVNIGYGNEIAQKSETLFCYVSFCCES